MNPKKIVKIHTHSLFLTVYDSSPLLFQDLSLDYGWYSSIDSGSSLSWKESLGLHTQASTLIFLTYYTEHTKARTPHTRILLYTVVKAKSINPPPQPVLKSIEETFEFFTEGLISHNRERETVRERDRGKDKRRKSFSS